jgi:hypothetical protein
VKQCLRKGLTFGCDWIFRHHIAPAHKELSVKQFLAKKSITEMKYPSFFPDLAQNDLWLFTEIKSSLKERRFQDIEDIQKKKM